MLRIIPMGGTFAEGAGEFGIGIPMENFLPNLQITGYMRLSIGLPAQPRQQQQKFRIGTKHRSRRIGGHLRPTQCLVVVPQLIRLGEVGLLRLRNSRQRVEVGRQPSPVFRQQLRYELRWYIGTCPDQIFPGAFGGSSTRDKYAARTNADASPVKVKNRTQGKQSLESRGLLQRLRRIIVEAGESPVETGHRGII